MANRRILSLWFPRLGAERALRLERGLLMAPLVTVARQGGAQVVASVSAVAAAQGVRAGQGLQDARAICPELVTRPEDTPGLALFLTVLRRWAGKFSPWVAEEPPAGLIMDLTGCAHLFGGEAALVAQAEADCAAQGLTVRLGLADTAGAAWALARYGQAEAGVRHAGDAIDQEARATRSRAVKRRNWERGGAAPLRGVPLSDVARIAAPGQVHTVLGGLPIAALRLAPETVEALAKVGLRRIGDIQGQPRAALARRFGRDLVRRLDQALGVEPEPITPAKPPERFAVRMSFPEPIGLEADVAAAVARLLPPLCAKLAAKGQGARRLRLALFRSGGGIEAVEIGLARPGRDAGQIAALFAMKLGALEAGYGFDMIRLEAHVVEPLHARPHRGGLDISQQNLAAGAGAGRDSDAMADLIARLGTRVGPEAITRRAPSDSHIPEKSAQTLAAAWSEPYAGVWPRPAVARPLVLFPPEIVQVAAGTGEDMPCAFRWRRQEWQVRLAYGPERIAPEWWFDDPAWRSGARDYWRVEARCGTRLWLYFAHGAALSAGWFCHGVFG